MKDFIIHSLDGPEFHCLSEERTTLTSPKKQNALAEARAQASKKKDSHLN